MSTIFRKRQTHNMSRSYHVTHKDIKHLSKKGIEDQAKDPNSLFSKWAKKLHIKVFVPKQRKQNKNLDL